MKKQTIQINSKKCLHKNVSKELIFDSDYLSWISTGDWICDDCGETFSENPNFKKQKRTLITLAQKKRQA